MERLVVVGMARPALVEREAQEVLRGEDTESLKMPTR
jgi:hypothetical protein